MISDMTGRNVGAASQTSHLRACKRFATWLGRWPETATPDDVKYFQHHLVESCVSICTRNQTMTGVKFLLSVTLRRHDLAAEIFSLREPVKVPLVLSKKEIKRILAMAPSLKAKVMLSLAYTGLPSRRNIVHQLCNSRQCLRPEHLQAGTLNQDSPHTMQDVLNLFLCAFSSIHQSLSIQCIADGLVFFSNFRFKAGSNDNTRSISRCRINTPSRRQTCHRHFQFLC